METTNDSTVPASNVAPAPTKRKSPGAHSQRHARELAKADLCATAARQSDRVDALTARDISTEVVDAHVAAIDAAREKMVEGVNAITARKRATAEERVAAKTLEAQLREVQKAAKQKYARSNRIALQDYFIGRPLNGNRANLQQTSTAIIDRATADTLPGITNTKKTKLKAARQAWVDAHTAKIAYTTAAQLAHTELGPMVKTVADGRLAIQLAADAEWPHTDPENAAIRKEFALPRRNAVRG